MIRRFVLAASLVLGLAAPAFAADKFPPIRAFDIPTVERLGAAIYRQDRAAWLATDALRAKFPNLADSGVRGWIVVGEGGAERVRFLRRTDGGGLEAGYDIIVDGKGAGPVVEPADRTLSDEERTAFAARQTAIAAAPPRCREGYNTAVVEDPDGDGWLVWLLAPSLSADAVPVGGHYRFTVSQDGRTLERTDALSASCLLMDRRPPEKDGATTMMFVTHIVSPEPVETHVFLSLLYRTPIAVGTRDKKVWLVEGGKITTLKMDR